MYCLYTPPTCSPEFSSGCRNKRVSSRKPETVRHNRNESPTILVFLCRMNTYHFLKQTYSTLFLSILDCHITTDKKMNPTATFIPAIFIKIFYCHCLSDCVNKTFIVITGNRFFFSQRAV